MQIGLPDDPPTSAINGFPFVTQALAGRYSSIDVTADRMQSAAAGGRVRSQLRDVTPPLSEVLGAGPRCVSVREVEGTARVGADDIERLISTQRHPGRQALHRVARRRRARGAVDDGADPSLADARPRHRRPARRHHRGARRGTPRSPRSSSPLDLTDGLSALLGPPARRPHRRTPTPRRCRSRRSGLPGRPSSPSRLDPGSLPLQVTPPTELKAVDGVLEISGSTTDLLLGPQPPPPGDARDPRGLKRHLPALARTWTSSA